MVEEVVKKVGGDRNGKKMKDVGRIRAVGNGSGGRRRICGQAGIRN